MPLVPGLSLTCLFMMNSLPACISTCSGSSRPNDAAAPLSSLSGDRAASTFSTKALHIFRIPCCRRERDMGTCPWDKCRIPGCQGEVPHQMSWFFGRIRLPGFHFRGRKAPVPCAG